MFPLFRGNSAARTPLRMAAALGQSNSDAQIGRRMTSFDPDRQPLSAVLRETVCKHDTISVDELMTRFGGRALGALLLVFGLLCSLPLPPGGTTVFGAPLVLLAPQLMFGRRSPWLPAKVRKRSIETRSLKKGLERVLPWLKRIEAVSRPRLSVLFSGVGQLMIGLVCTVFAIVLILPIPLGNMLPAAAVSVLSLSLVQRDGLLALVGYALAAASVGVLALAGGVIVRTLQHLVLVVAPA
jgi:hypothetical protein